MMYEREKSDPAEVARKLTNGGDGSSPEPVERRAGTKGNTIKTCMRRTPSRASMFPGLERVRERARHEKKERFTALLPCSEPSPQCEKRSWLRLTKTAILEDLPAH
jgi:RNA-directed DNA polymerase